MREEEPVQVRDAREETAWFQRLPEHAQREMREAWALQDGVTLELRERRRRTRTRFLIEGAVFFLVMFWLFYIWTWDGALVALLAGLATGAVADFLRAGAYRFATVGLIGYLAFALIQFGIPSIFPAVFATFGCGMLGVGHTLNRYDFTEG